MRVCAIDTALGACSVALAEDGVAAASVTEPMRTGHAERVAPMLAGAMAQAGWRFDSLDRIAVTTGPGTFTGQRVGLAFARGLALATGAACAGVTTLEALAASAAAARPVFAAIDARRGEVYAQAFEADGAPLSEPALLSLDQAAALAAGLDAPLLCGTGQELIAALLAPGSFGLSGVEQIDPVALARLAATRDPSLHPPKPLYLRAADAKLPGPMKPLPPRRDKSLPVREAGPADAALIAGLHARAFADPWDAASIAKLMSGPGALALVAGTPPLGFALFHSVPPEAELLSVGVVPEARGRGIAGRLLAEAARRLIARGVETIFLDVAEGNAPARALYARLGFVERSRRPRYYRNGDDALMLTAASARVAGSLASALSDAPE